MSDTPVELSHEYWIDRWKRFFNGSEDLIDHGADTNAMIGKVLDSLEALKCSAAIVLKAQDPLFWSRAESIYIDVANSIKSLSIHSFDPDKVKLNIHPGMVNSLTVLPLTDYEVYVVLYHRALFGVSTIIGLHGMAQLKGLLAPHDPPIDDVSLLRRVACAPGIAAMMAFPATFIHFARLSTLPLVQRIATVALSAWVSVRTDMSLYKRLTQILTSEEIKGPALSMEIDAQVAIAFAGGANDMASCMKVLQRNCIEAVIRRTPLRSGGDPIRDPVMLSLRKFLETQAVGRELRHETLDLEAFEAQEGRWLGDLTASVAADEHLEFIRATAEKACLTDAERAVLELRLRGLSPREIAEKRGTTVATVSAQWVALTEKLKGAIGE